MDMSSLSSGLPRPAAEDPTNKAFKEAALSLTNLYKAAQGARREGYRDAIDELYNLFLKDRSDVDTARLATWIEERRRRPAEPTKTEEPHSEDVLEDYSVMISPSPITRSRSENRDGRERRDRERKRRGGGDVVTDLHKRGRYDRA